MRMANVIDSIKDQEEEDICLHEKECKKRKRKGRKT
jgi:hypothetical protein